jgi:hypothetical protein
MNQMLKIKLVTTILSALLFGVTNAQATVVPTSTKEINVLVSNKSGHLLNWSKTNQRIQMVMIESPEETLERITFSIPGCQKNACGSDSSLMLINSRKGKTSGVAALRVITLGKKGTRNIYRVRIRIINGEVPSDETETEFLSFKPRPATSP